MSSLHAATLDLTEAIREVQLMAGITDRGASTLRVARRGQAAWKPDPAVPFLERGLKGVKQLSPEVAPAVQPAVIGVTSVGRREGKTTLAMALANSLAHDWGARVVLVDADFATHSIGPEYGLGRRPGLSDVILGNVPLEAAVQRFGSAPLSVVTAGLAPIDAAWAARSEALAAAVGTLKRWNTFVVLDLPAVEGSADGPVLAQHCDGVLVVARAGKTDRRDLERALLLLRDANLLGVVVNRYQSNVPRWAERWLALAQ
ncbi:MAG: CpsD/CapB family tyrosine-protein kinase [Dehalococcoidia bacterium]